MRELTRVLRRRDVHVMAAIVLDAEVAIADQAVHDLRGDAIRAARLVAELVTDQERAALENPCRASARGTPTTAANACR